MDLTPLVRFAAGIAAIVCSMFSSSGWCEYDVNGAVLFLVAPEYKPQWRENGLSGTVTVAGTVGADGTAKDVHVTSRPSAFDSEVTDAVRVWLFQPPICVGNGIEQYEAHFDVAFEREGDRYFVAVRNARYTVPGERASAQSVLIEPTRMSGDDPVYPRGAIKAGLRSALVVAALRINEDGSVKVRQLFSAPKKFFEDEVRMAVEGWRFAPRLDDKGNLVAFNACVPVKFTMREPE